MEYSKVKAVLFVKDLQKVAAFYSDALGMKCSFSDNEHSVLNCYEFTLIVHQIPKEIADGITIDAPPKRRIQTAVRLDYPVHNVADSRRQARLLGGDIDDAPQDWAEPDANFFFGYDPEGNQFGVSEHTY